MTLDALHVTRTIRAAREPARPRRAGRLVPPVAGAVLGVAVWWLMRRALVDDAFITLTYARTLGLHGEWGMYEGLPSNTATSPLNVMLLGAATAVTRDPIVAVGVVTAGLFAASGWWLDRVGEHLGLRQWALPALGLGVFGTEPLLVSTIGLESYLALTLLVGAARYALPGRWIPVGVVAGALVLTRPDLAVVAALLVGMAGRAWWRTLVVGAAVAAPRLVWSWWNLGSAVPDSVLLKASASWGDWDFADGLALHYTKLPQATALSVLPALVGLVALSEWLRDPNRRLGLVWGVGPLANGAVFVALDTAPYHWYYAPLLGGLGMLGVASAARWGRVALAAAAALVVLSGVAVWNDGLPRQRAPISVNWATAAQYEANAASLPAGATIASPGEIGTLAYFCWDCRVIDAFADPGYIWQRIEQVRAEAGPVKRWLIGVNYARFEPRQPLPLDYRLVTAPVDPVGAPMVGSWGEGRSIWLGRVP